MSRDILLSLIEPDPEQPRKHFDETAINELAQSIEANGLAVPILLRPVGDRFVIVHGERRYRAVKHLSWEAVPAEVRDIDADTAHWLALAENVQRADLSPIEEAQAYQELVAQGITQTELAKRIGKTQSYIAQKIRLLKLPESVQIMLDRGELDEGHTRQLLRLHYNVQCAKIQERLAKLTVENGWSVRRLKLQVDYQKTVLDAPWYDLDIKVPDLVAFQKRVDEGKPEHNGEMNLRAMRNVGGILNFTRVYADVGEGSFAAEILQEWSIFSLNCAMTAYGTSLDSHNELTLSPDEVHARWNHVLLFDEEKRERARVEKTGKQIAYICDAEVMFAVRLAN